MLDITPVKKKHLSLYLYKITVTVIMLHTIYTSAKQALESHYYNIQIQWYCWWVGNKNSHLTACKSLFFIFQFSAVEGIGGMFSVTACTKFSCTEIQMRDAWRHFCIWTFYSLTASQLPRVQKLYSHFSWIRLNIQRIFFSWVWIAVTKRATEI